MFNITKQFSFDAGHRVYNQKLDDELSNNGKNRCRYLHGHTYTVNVTIQNNDLKNDMVLDFNNLKIFKSYLDEIFDHGYMMYIEDPLFIKLLELINKEYNMSDIISLDQDVTRINLVEDVPTLPIFIIEFISSLTICKFNPTAENMAKFFYEWIQKEVISKTENCSLLSVEVLETPKTSAVYFGGYNNE